MQTIDNIKKGLACHALGRNRLLPCSDCAYHGPGLPPCGKAVHEDAIAMLERLESQVPKWISVETPPQEAGEYIVLIRYPDGREIRTFNIFHPDAGWCPNDLVDAVQTHWMSFYALPKPPKEET